MKIFIAKYDCLLFDRCCEKVKDIIIMYCFVGDIRWIVMGTAFNLGSKSFFSCGRSPLVPYSYQSFGEFVVVF